MTGSWRHRFLNPQSLFILIFDPIIDVSIFLPLLACIQPPSQSPVLIFNLGCRGINMKLDGWWEEEERWAFNYFILVNSSAGLCKVPWFFSLWLPILWAATLPWMSVSSLWKPAKDVLLTTCSLSNMRRLPRLIFLALSSRWFMVFPYVAIKLLESLLGMN